MTSHILCIDCFPTWGGGEAVLVKHVTTLLTSGHRITMVCPNGSPLLQGALPDAVEVVGLTMDAGLTDYSQRVFSARVLLSQARLAMQLSTIIRQHGIAMVYALGSRSAKVALPAVVTQHIPLCWSAHNPYQLSILDGFLFRYSAAVICVSDAIRKQYQGMPGSQTRLHLLYNSIDVAAFASADGSGFRRELRLSNQDILVGMIGRISPEKGQLRFVEVMLPLLREFASLHAVIIGSALEQDRFYETQLMEAIAQNGMAHRFTLSGWRSDVQALLPALDIVAQTFSREAFPMVIIEAMAAARPVVAFATGGVAEAIVDGTTGVVLPQGGIDAMTQSIRHLILNPAERAKMGQAGQHRARELFDDGIVLPGFTAIIDAVLRQR